MAPSGRGAGERFTVGDPLRAVAALSVLGFHAALAARSSRAPGDRADFGSGGRLILSLDIGLFIFFALSGYLLARPFARSLVTGAPLPAVGAYVRNRLLRIVPAFWAVWTVTLLIVGADGFSKLRVLAVYGFAQVYTTTPAGRRMPQAWTLDVELVFYLVLPLAAFALAAVLARRPAGQVAVAILAALALVSLAGLWLRGVPGHVKWPPSLAIGFAPGIALAVAEPLVRDRATRRWSAALLAVAALGTVAYVIAPFHVRPRTVLAVIACGSLIGAALTRQWSGAPAWRVLDNRVAHWVGERSYSLYLVQSIVLLELLPLIRRGHTLWQAFAIALATGLVGTLAAAAVSFEVAERPFLRRRRRWRPAEASGSAQSPVPAPVPSPAAGTSPP